MSSKRAGAAGSRKSSGGHGTSNKDPPSAVAGTEDSSDQKPNEDPLHGKTSLERVDSSKSKLAGESKPKSNVTFDAIVKNAQSGGK